MVSLLKMCLVKVAGSNPYLVVPKVAIKFLGVVFNVSVISTVAVQPFKSWILESLTNTEVCWPGQVCCNS